MRHPKSVNLKFNRKAMLNKINRAPLALRGKLAGIIEWETGLDLIGEYDIPATWHHDEEALQYHLKRCTNWSTPLTYTLSRIKKGQGE